ncbi:calcium/calmodulin-dependent protein kinase I [Trichomonascus vanleenenianus]|uniref:serine/threonine-protein kinase n=1 Tax=Trichomonascus vanleenenianus TaxID=2268995 RepID=UPI003EC9B815
MNDKTSSEPIPCKYKVGRQLGQGTYSVVKEAVHIETGKFYAAKIISKQLMSGREHMVRNEIIVLRRVSQGHRNVLTLVDYFETKNSLYLITDLAKGGELFDRIYNKGNYLERDAACIVKAVTSGVAYLHRHGIVHRDLKPENLLFRTSDEDSDLLIADFGLSRIIDEEKFRMLTTTCGTPSYMAPEIFQKTGHHKPVDVWAIGVITYFLLCGYTPFDRDSSAEEMQAILDADYEFEPEQYWSHASDNAKDFIRKCLRTDPGERMTAQQALEHEFLAQVEDERIDNTCSSSSSITSLELGTTAPVFDSHIDEEKRKGTISIVSEPAQVGPSSSIASEQMGPSAWDDANREIASIKNTGKTMEGAFSMSPQNTRLVARETKGGFVGVINPDLANTAETTNTTDTTNTSSTVNTTSSTTTSSVETNKSITEKTRLTGGASEKPSTRTVQFADETSISK